MRDDPSQIHRRPPARTETQELTIGHETHGEAGKIRSPNSISGPIYMGMKCKCPAIPSALEILSHPAGLKATHAYAVPAIAVGAKALGTMALGAVAIGACAVGAIAIGRLAIGRARIKRLDIDELVVRRLRVAEELTLPFEPATDLEPQELRKQGHAEECVGGKSTMLRASP